LFEQANQRRPLGSSPGASIYIRIITGRKKIGIEVDQRIRTDNRYAPAIGRALIFVRPKEAGTVSLYLLLTGNKIFTRLGAQACST